MLLFIFDAFLFQVHAYIISHLHDNMPSMFGKDKAKNNLIKDLDKIFVELSNKYNISLGKY